MIAINFARNDQTNRPKFRSMRTEFNNIDEYINNFSEEIQVLLNQIRRTIRQAAPEAEESISYGMPAFKTNGMPLVYFRIQTSD